MKTFKFNSQICTTIEQSKRLLDLGIKKETADMAYRTTGKVVDMGEVRWMYQHNPSVVYKGMTSEEDIPAWSLHRLIEMSHYYDLYFCMDYIYDGVIDHIEFLIEKNEFNSEYLEEKQ